MKKIILYGCGPASVEIRRNIEFFIGKTYEIIGCVDGKYDHDALDNKNYFRLDELCDLKYDFILLCSKRESTLEKMLNWLIERGVDRKKILVPLLFMDKSNERSRFDLISEISNCYSGEPNLIFGMSYSYTDLIQKNLKIPFYRCCCHGMDLYYSFAVYKYMFAKKLVEKVNIVVFNVCV